jgi:hypothetical protein
LHPKRSPEDNVWPGDLGCEQTDEADVGSDIPEGSATGQVRFDGVCHVRLVPNTPTTNMTWKAKSVDRENRSAAFGGAQWTQLTSPPEVPDVCVRWSPCSDDNRPSRTDAVAFFGSGGSTIGHYAMPPTT